MHELVEKLNLPVLSPLPQRHWWVVDKDWVCEGYTVPRGFCADLDSIPTIPLVYLLFKGRARAAALMHDYHYATNLITRKQADDLFYEMSMKENVSKPLAFMMWLGVRAFGWYPYNKSQKIPTYERLTRRMVDKDGHAQVLNDE